MLGAFYSLLGRARFIAMAVRSSERKGQPNFSSHCNIKGGISAFHSMLDVVCVSNKRGGFLICKSVPAEFMAETLLLNSTEAVMESALHMLGSQMARKIRWLTGQRKKLREINISTLIQKKTAKNQLLGLSPKLLYVSLYFVNNSFKARALLPYPIFFAQERKRNTMKEFVLGSLIFITV